jgi:hypothetical protein
MEIKMVRLTEIVEENMATNFSVRSVFVNPCHVVMVRDDNRFRNLLGEGKLSHLGVDSNMQFCRITVRGGSGNYEITVMGSSDMVYEKIQTSTKTLLKG